MKTVVIIPARYASKRLPGKPLHLINGIPMIQRVWRVATEAVGEDSVYVATDSTEIESLVTSFGGKVCMTSEGCRNGTERAFEAASSLAERPDIVINMQGDVPLLPPVVLKSLAETMQKESCPMGTPAWQLAWDEVDALKAVREAGGSSGTLVTFDRNFQALYFSSALIPYLRSRPETPLSPLFRHIGIYGFTFACLEQYMSLEPTPLEQIEKLEQLRALENNIPIRVVPVDLQGKAQWSVDAPEDVARVEQILKDEGDWVKEGGLG